MTNQEIKQIDIFKIQNTSTKAWFYGCYQDLYISKWKRLAGCGPSVASNLVLYHMAKHGISAPSSQEACVSLMNEVWKYVTPGFQGVSSTQHFTKGLMKYFEAKKILSEMHIIDVSKNKINRITLDEVICFIQEGLNQDSPIAFLNLHNGEEKNLDQWHWVNIVSLNTTDDLRDAMVDILDDGKRFEINLALWLETTQQGGGFVYIT